MRSETEIHAAAAAGDPASPATVQVGFRRGKLPPIIYPTATAVWYRDSSLIRVEFARISGVVAQIMGGTFLLSANGHIGSGALKSCDTGVGDSRVLQFKTFQLLEAGELGKPHVSHQCVVQGYEH